MCDSVGPYDLIETPEISWAWCQVGMEDSPQAQCPHSLLLSPVIIMLSFFNLHLGMNRDARSPFIRVVLLQFQRIPYVIFYYISGYYNLTIYYITFTRQFCLLLTVLYRLRFIFYLMISSVMCSQDTDSNMRLLF